MALHRLSPDDIEALASDTQPLLTSLPHRPKERAPHSRASRRLLSHRARDRPYPVSRRLRRYHNDLRLFLNAAESGSLPTNIADYKSLFERSPTSAWTLLHNDKDAHRTWQHFSELEDDEQHHLLEHNSTIPPPKVDKTLKLLIKHRGPVVTDVVRQVEDTVVQLPQGGVVHLKMPHALGRMVAHHVAQFHSMKHRSVDIGSERVTVIHATNPVGSGPRLVDVLAA